MEEKGFAGKLSDFKNSDLFNPFPDDMFEGLDHNGIELLTCILDDLFHRLPGRHSLAIRPVTCHRIKGICHGYDTGA